jgi:hypothetical protein
MPGRFEYRQAQELAGALAKHRVRYLFIGKSGAIILGFPDTTQDADLFIERSPENGRALVAALADLGFPLAPQHRDEIERGKDFVQLRYGPFDLDLVFAPDGIETLRRRTSGPSRLKGCASVTSTTSSGVRRRRAG